MFDFKLTNVFFRKTYCANVKMRLKNEHLKSITFKLLSLKFNFF